MVYSFTFVYFRFFYLSVFFNIKNRFYYYFSNHNILYVSPECLSTYVQTIIVTCDTLKVFYYEMFNMERSVKAFGGYRTYFIQWRWTGKGKMKKKTDFPLFLNLWEEKILWFISVPACRLIEPNANSSGNCIDK